VLAECVLAPPPVIFNGCFTTIGVEPVTPSTVTLRVVTPADTALSLPDGLTLATRGFVVL
jgi:hypothetical protein